MSSSYESRHLAAADFTPQGAGTTPRATIIAPGALPVYALAVTSLPEGMDIGLQVGSTTAPPIPLHQGHVYRFTPPAAGGLYLESLWPGTVSGQTITFQAAFWIDVVLFFTPDFCVEPLPASVWDAAEKLMARHAVGAVGGARSVLGVGFGPNNRLIKVESIIFATSVAGDCNLAALDAGIGVAHVLNNFGLQARRRGDTWTQLQANNLGPMIFATSTPGDGVFDAGILTLADLQGIPANTTVTVDDIDVELWNALAAGTALNPPQGPALMVLGPVNAGLHATFHIRQVVINKVRGLVDK